MVDVARRRVTYAEYVAIANDSVYVDRVGVIVL
jgi:hypothetical protein